MRSTAPIFIVSATPIQYLDELARLSREDVNFVVRDGTASVCVATRQSAHSDPPLCRMSAAHGPLHVGGGSTVLLAYAPKDVIQDSVLAGEARDVDASTLTDPIEARSASRTGSERDGYHVSRDDVDVSGFSIGVPVWGQRHDRRCRHQHGRTDEPAYDERSAHHRELLMDYADRMSRGSAVRNRRGVPPPAWPWLHSFNRRGLAPICPSRAGFQRHH